MTDPFGAAGIRSRVLAGWAAAPARLREDANAEEDLALGGYRDRVVVELAQNAADAAARAGVPGRLRLTLTQQPDGSATLVAANTGDPLTPAGVQSLATLRASAKSGSDAGRSVGRFGVGFASVLAVTDEPAVFSRTGGVRFSRSATARAVAELAPLADEVRRRNGHVPALRLPFATDDRPPPGFDTAVVLPLRDPAAVHLVRQELAHVDDVLLLALPALHSIEVDVAGAVTELADVRGRWHVASREGSWTRADRAELFADRPTEEGHQSGWQVLWALPHTRSAPLPGTVHAPTATDEPQSLPALLIASFPLDPTRRHVAPGGLTDRLVGECAATYAALLEQRAAAGDDVMSLVPTGLAAGALDAALREAVLDRLPDVRLLPSVEHPGELLRPREAVVLDVPDDPGALAVLAPLVAGLVAAPRRDAAALAALQVGRLALPDVVDALPAAGEPEAWRVRYAGLAALADDANAREVLGSLPVPLADGRVVRGARGTLLASDDTLPVEALVTLSGVGVRLVHPSAAHPLLLRLGSVPATARAVLEHPAVRAAVEARLDDDGADDLAAEAGADELATAVLSLVAVALGDAAVVPGRWADGALSWLADLVLMDDEGEPAPAGGLALPGSPAAALLDRREVSLLDEDVAAAWPRKVLVAVGVLEDLGTARANDVDLDDLPDALAGLADVELWADDVGEGFADELVAIRDLDVVRAGSWPEALQHIGSVPALRRALVEMVRVTGRDGVRSVPSYAAWWLRRRLGTAGLLDPAAGGSLRGLLDDAPPWVQGLDAGVGAALGLVSDLGAGGAGLATLVLQRLTDPGRDIDVATCLQAWALVAAHAGDLDVVPTRMVRVLGGAGTQVVPAAQAVVPDDPRWLQRGDLGGFVVVAAQHSAAVADLLDLPLASELAAGSVLGSGVVVDVPWGVRRVVPQAPQVWREYDELLVDGQEVDWWADTADVYAATTDGLARALAFAAGDWSARYAIASVLAEPGDAVRLLIEDAAG